MENCVVKFMLGIFFIFSIPRGLQVQSSPSASLCRVCDTHDPTVQDDCYQTVGKRHQVCTTNCITRFSKAASGLRIQKSCADDAVCISEWWEDSSLNPDCQRSKLTDASATLSPWVSCSVCCNSATGNDIYCSDDIFPQNSSLLQYPGVDRSTQTASSDQVKNDSATSSAPMQSYSKQEHVTVGDTDEYPQPMICANCPNIDQKSSSSCDAMIRCYGDKPLCMTSFFDDGRQNLLEVKRCAAVSECWDLWYNKTRLRSDCMGDINHDPYSWTGRKSGECHYCCHTPRGETDDWCNKAMWPTKPRNLVDMIDYAKSVLPQATTTVKNEPSTTAQPTTEKIIPSTTTTLSSTTSTTEQATTRTTAEETRTTQKATTAEETTKDEMKPESTTSPQSTTPEQTKTRQTSPTMPETTLDQIHEETTGAPFTTTELKNESRATATTEATSKSPRTTTNSASTTTSTQESVASTRPASYSVTTNNPNVLKSSTTRVAFSTTLPTPLEETNLTTNASTYTEPTPTTNGITTPDSVTAAETTTQENVNVSAGVKSTTTSADDISTTATTTKTATAVTTQATTATTIQATATTVQATTATTTQPTTATTAQATTTSSTTIQTTPATLQSPVPPRLRCESCNDAALQGQLCQSGRIEFCPDDEGYCLNTIDFSPSAGGSKSMAVSKKCASFLACMSSNINSAECYGDINDPSSVTPGTRCNFCCNDTSPLGIPCNTNLRPEKTISFLPQPPPVSRKCYQCGNPLTGEPCGPGDLLLGASSSCPADKQFCMNDIFDKAGGGRTIYKRCVDETECRNKWFKESSDTNECAYYDPRGSVASDLTCHFCCIEDGCNRSTKPAENTLWTPFNTGG